MGGRALVDISYRAMSGYPIYYVKQFRHPSGSDSAVAVTPGGNPACAVVEIRQRQMAIPEFIESPIMMLLFLLPRLSPLLIGTWPFSQRSSFLLALADATGYVA